jgi:LPS sulfotransferase NodH
MYKMYLVCGGEATGNKLLTQILIDAGCFGDASPAQRLDNLSTFDGDQTRGKSIVFLRSFPSGGVYPDLSKIYNDFCLHGFFSTPDEIFGVMPTRNWACAIDGSIGLHTTNFKEALHRLQTSYISASRGFADLGVDFEVVSFEALTMKDYDANFGYLKYLDWRLRLGVDDPFIHKTIISRLRNENKKHWAKFPFSWMGDRKEG